MGIISRVIDSVIIRGLREIKVICFGSDDVRTANQISPYGDDSNPIDDLRAVYMDTSNSSDPVIIGYINENLLAEKGEKRFYSQKSNGEISYFIHLKNDGTCELNGDADNAVRFSPLSGGLDDLVAGVNRELIKIQTGIAAAGGTYEPQDVEIDISDAKIDELKTN